MIATEPKKETLNLGFLGLGWIGRNRMEAILEHSSATAAAIVDPVDENALVALESAVNSTRFNDYEDLLLNPSIDGIVIATPSALHAEQSVQALKAGKAVFCQKPLGRSVEEVRKVIQASKEADKLLQVDLSYRYTNAFKEIYKLVQNKEIGEIYAIDLIFHNAYGPDKEWFYNIEQSGGGCVMDLGIHLVDLALWTLRFPEITKINSHLFHKGKKLESFDDVVEDFASVTMTSESDAIINLACSWNLPAGQEAVIEARFYGTDGGAAFRNINGSFYDFVAEKYHGTSTEVLISPPDTWSGRAGVIWAQDLVTRNKFNKDTAEEFVKTAEVIDRIYGR